MDQVDRNSAQPLYRQIKQEIRGRISRGEWRPGGKIPSENELVEWLGVSRMTVHRALRDLSQEGVLRRVHGRGTFVCPPQRHASLVRLRDIAEEISERGDRHRCRVLARLKIKASADVALQMECRESSGVFYLEALHYQDDLPIQLEQRYVNPDMAPAFMEQNLERRTATGYLMELYRPDEMEHIVRAVMPDPKVRELLAMDPTQPCLMLSRRTWNDGRVVTWATMLYPGDRYDLAARYSTNEYRTLNL